MTDYIFCVHNAEQQKHEWVQSGVRQIWQKRSSVTVQYNDLDSTPNSFDHKNTESCVTNRYPTHSQKLILSTAPWWYQRQSYGYICLIWPGISYGLSYLRRLTKVDVKRRLLISQSYHCINKLFRKVTCVASSLHSFNSFLHPTYLLNNLQNFELLNACDWDSRVFQQSNCLSCVPWSQLICLVTTYSWDAIMSVVCICQHSLFPIGKYEQFLSLFICLLVLGQM